jgi:hypothetical protein
MLYQRLIALAKRKGLQISKPMTLRSSRPGAKAKFNRTPTVQVVPDDGGVGDGRARKGWFIVLNDENGGVHQWHRDSLSVAKEYAQSIANHYKARLMSRPGAKAAFAWNSATTRLNNSLNQALRDMKSGDMRQAELHIRDVQGWLFEFGDKLAHSRPGAKAKFGRAERQLPNGEVHLDFSAAKEWLSALPPEQLRYIMKDAREAANANPDGKKFNYYQDLALTAGDILRKRMNASRSGAKAKFVTGKFTLVVIDLPGKPHFDFNTLREARDYHDKHFGTMRGEIIGPEHAVVAEKGYGDRWSVFHSRPGAKEKFSRADPKKRNDLTEACWEGYEAVGTKKKDGKTVPNCVPKKANP